MTECVWSCREYSTSLDIPAFHSIDAIITIITATTGSGTGENIWSEIYCCLGSNAIAAMVGLCRSVCTCSVRLFARCLCTLSRALANHRQSASASANGLPVRGKPQRKRKKNERTKKKGSPRWKLAAYELTILRSFVRLSVRSGGSSVRQSGYSTEAARARERPGVTSSERGRLFTERAEQLGSWRVGAIICILPVEREVTDMRVSVRGLSTRDRLSPPPIFFSPCSPSSSLPRERTWWIEGLTEAEQGNTRYPGFDFGAKSAATAWSAMRKVDRRVGLLPSCRREVAVRLRSPDDLLSTDREEYCSSTAVDEHSAQCSVLLSVRCLVASLPRR